MRTSVRRVTALLMVSAFVLAACSGGSTPVPSASAGGAESIGASASVEPSAETPSLEPTLGDARAAAGLAFVRRVGEIEELFVIDPDGTARQVSGLGEHAGVGAAIPVWSPDRSMIAFAPPTIGSGLDPQLWVVDADGTEQRPIAPLGESTEWSPDSSRLLWTDSVYTTDNTGEYARIWIGDVASGEVTQLGPRGTVTHWHPDGDQISFLPPESEPHVVLQPLGGGDARDLVTGVGPWWSPDGTVMLVEREDGIYLADADGTNDRLLLPGAAAPAWAPDGARVAFSDVDETGTFVVGVADLDGTVLWNNVPGTDASWSPDGTKLAVEVYDPDGPFIEILDGESGAAIWQVEGRFPDW